MMKYIRLFEELAQPHYEYYPDGQVKEEWWRLDGHLHREDGPAVIRYYPDGQVKEEEWRLDGHLHREDGPAGIEYYPDGQVKEEWWRLDGWQHREDGPAAIWYYPDGQVRQEEWWLNHKAYSQAEHEARSPATSIDRLDSIAAGDDSRLAELAKENLKGRDFTGWVFNDTWE